MIRSVRLARAAFDAQILIAKSASRRTIRQVAFLIVGGLFGLFALALLHLAFYLALSSSAGIAPVWSALIVVGGDLVVGITALLLARAGGPDPVAIEARITRDRAVGDLKGSLAIATLAGPAGRMAARGALGLVRGLFRRKPSPRQRR